MPIKVQLTALAVGLAIAGIAVLRHQRKVLKRDRYSKLAVAIASLLGCCFLLGGCGLAAFTFYPRGGFNKEAENAPALAPVAESPADGPDAQDRRAVIGTWTDNYQGKRTMTLRKDGTGTMVVELSGLTATLYAERLRFDMVWSLKDRRLKKQTIGGEPAGKVDLILKLMGDRVDEPILELTEDRLVLLDKDGTTKYTWTRVP